MSYINVMLDLETLGTKPGCKILSIGACTFGEDSRTEKRTFERVIKRDTQSGLVEDPNVVDWWDKQSNETKAHIFNNPDATHLYNALLDFNTWLTSLGAIPIIWGNAATFDCSILKAAYEKNLLMILWNYRNERCFRTLKNLVSKDIEPPFQGVKHSALDDALHQAVWAERIYQMLRLNWD